MGIIERLKQLFGGGSAGQQPRSETSEPGAATDSAEQLWYEGKHETAPIGDSDAGTTFEPPATPDRRTPPE